MATNSNRTYIVRPGGTTSTSAVSLTASTAKSVVAVLGTTGTTLSLDRVRISFNSSDATVVPALVEIGIITALGTVTSMTPSQVTGLSQASAASAGYNATVEPTYNRLIDAFYAPVAHGHVTDWVPLGFEPMAANSQGFAVRVTTGTAGSYTCLVSMLYGE